MMNHITRNHQERRNKDRIAFHLPVSIIGLNEKAQIVDFSLNGFFVRMESTSDLKVGQQVRLALRFPHEKNSTVIKAKIVRTEKNGFGCHFVDLDPLVLDLLEKNFVIFSATLPID
jgi:hypothetical protein